MLCKPVVEFRQPATEHLLSLVEPLTLADLPFALWYVTSLPPPGDAVPGPLRPGIETRRLSGGSHWSPLDEADEVNAQLREFLRPLDEAAGGRRGAGGGL